MPIMFHNILCPYYFWPTRTTKERNNCSECLFGGSERAEEGDRISLLKSNGQTLKQEYCLPGVLSDYCDPPANFLALLYCHRRSDYCNDLERRFR